MTDLLQIKEKPLSTEGTALDRTKILTASARRALVAVAAHGTFAAAARDLKLSQPAVSQQIRDMEREGNVVLFERRAGRLLPTPFCVELLEISEQIATLEQRAASLLERRNAISGGHLRLALGNSMPGMALIAAFQSDYPGAKVSVSMNDYERTVEAVLSRRVDIGILPDLKEDPRLQLETLVEQEVVAIAHPDLPINQSDRIDCRDLMRQPLIFRSPGSSTQRVVDAAFAKQGLTPEPRLVLDTRDGVYEAVANRLGVGFMWRYGTGRSDSIRRIDVVGVSSPYPESVFRLKESRGALLDAFFTTARVFRRNSRLFLVPGSSRPRR